MAATGSKIILSGSTNGKPIVVTGTSTGASVTVHTAVAGTSSYDEVWVYAMNKHTAPVVVTIEHGEATNPVVVTIPNNSGLVPIIPGIGLNNTQVVKAFAGTANVISIYGFVNQLT